MLYLLAFGVGVIVLELWVVILLLVSIVQRMGPSVQIVGGYVHGD